MRGSKYVIIQRGEGLTISELSTIPTNHDIPTRNEVHCTSASGDKNNKVLLRQKAQV